MDLFTITAFICKKQIFAFSVVISSFYFVSNNECPTCEAKLAAGNELSDIQLRPKDCYGEDNLKAQLIVINHSLQELKNLMMQQKEEQSKMSKNMQ